ATGTDTYERNRNLLLTDGARADSVPNLEILTGEVVGAGHASASGRLEDHHLFYLMARGIPEDEARRLVIRGFFGELIAKIGVPELRDRITEAIEAELAAGAPEGRRWARAGSSSAPARWLTCPMRAPSGWRSRACRSPWCAPRARCLRCTTCARTRRSRCPRARSTTTRWNAGCTGRVSTCAPAARPGLPPPS